VALSVTLLVGAVLLIRSFQRLTHVDPWIWISCPVLLHKDTWTRASRERIGRRQCS
jgi:hypothetical protein